MRELLALKQERILLLPNTRYTSVMQNDAIHIKKELRHEVLTRRDAMLASAREQASHAICRKIKDQLAFLSAGSTVAVYAPMKSEVNLGDFIVWCYTQKLTVVFPCMNIKGSTPRMYMRLVEYRAWRDGNVPFIANPLKRFAEDDRSVSDFPVRSPRSIDAIIVPMVAFDSDFQRLGYGGGNYDEYLGLISREKIPGANVEIIGVAFETQRVNQVPTEPHDLPLPCIISA